ncbi:hypothetical protein HOK51_11240 [Candidatus Woesearchaeota archaeon]|jgi:hypothetical protein|nr:hypothetical protein [Candidatus Woesearchaeota archaeon]MBT6520397.1 hypothetical protein [Candidatus Woesearchaeota archaeon]MBT7368646.1 hypothetical protein [Candidatus Woesearchaeota archaeon]
MKKLKFVLVLVILMCIIVLAGFVSALTFGEFTDYATGGFMRSDKGIPTDWYEVDDWEIDACTEWGGATSTANSELEDISIVLENTHLIATINAMHHEIEDGSLIYEIAWFIQPSDYEETIDWEISTKTNNGIKKILDNGNANYYNGHSGYFTVQSEFDLKTATLKWSGESEGEIEVPFRNKDEFEEAYTKDAKLLDDSVEKSEW